jgi:glutamine synthetase
MDIAPDDRGENVRREICLTLEQMGIAPLSSHHRYGPGQHRVDFRRADALAAADNAVTFKTVVKTIAANNGLYAEFSPKPLEEEAGSSLHICLDIQPAGLIVPSEAAFVAGIMAHAVELCAVLNPSEESYLRLGAKDAPGYVSWSAENHFQFMRVTQSGGKPGKIELLSPDPLANPYIAFALLLYAGCEGVKQGLSLPAPADFDLYGVDPHALEGYTELPRSLKAAKEAAAASAFLREFLPEGLFRALSRI